MNCHFIGLLFLSLLTLGYSVSQGLYKNEKGNFSLSWDIQSEDVVFTMSMKATAYIAVGFGGSMLDADMIIGWIDSTSGLPFVGDYYSNAEIMPTFDVDLGGTNDVFLVSGSIENGQTTIVFKRKLDTKDKYDKVIKISGSNDMVYAWGSNSNGLSKDDPIDYHGDSHNHIFVDLSKSNGIPDDVFGYEESGMLSRDLVKSAYFGTLSTLQSQAAGSESVYNFPFGSIVDFSDELPSTGKPLILLSDLERSVINMKTNPKLSLSIATLPNSTFAINHPELFDVMTKPRTTLLGYLSPVPENELEVAKQTYLVKHPMSKSWINFSDFTMYRMIVEDVYVVGGFGNTHYIGWVSAEQYFSLKIQ